MADKKESKAEWYRKKITDEIIKAMENGTTPWQKAWDGKAGATIIMTPINGFSKHPYTKENLLRLSIIMNKKAVEGKVDPRFFTLKQANNLGYSVLKGHHGTCVKMGFYSDKDKHGIPLPKEECHWASRYFPVFHASDLAKSYEHVKDADGKPVFEPDLDNYGNPILDQDGNPKMREAIRVTEPIDEYVPPKAITYTHEEQYDLAEQMLQRSGAKIIHDRADENCYIPSKDEIHLVSKEAFPELAGYYATALHELGHWTGAKSRLNRPGIVGFHSFGDEAYAKEELRAELASVFLSADTGLPIDTRNHAAYLKSWIKNLKEDKKELRNAMNDAHKITAYVEDLVRDKLKKKTSTKAQTEETVKQPEGKTEEPKTIEVSGETVKKPEEEEQVAEKPKRLFKYLCKFRPAQPGSVPKDGMEYYDPDDKAAQYGAVYYNRQLKGEEMKQYMIDLDRFYESEQFHRVTIYQAPKEADWCFQDFGTASRMAMENHEPMDFSVYEQKYVDDVPAMKDGKALSTEEILEHVYEKFNREDRPAGMSMRSVSMSDVLRLDDDFYYVDSQGFAKLQIMPFKDKQIIKAAPNAQLEELIAKQKQEVGEDVFADYQKRFHKAFFDGAKCAASGNTPTTADKYVKFLFDNSVQYGLSSVRPCDQKAWEQADTKFLEKAAFDSKLDASVMQNATNAVQRNSPYTAVANNVNYAFDLMKKVMHSQPYLDMKEQLKNEPEREAVACAAAGR